MSVLDPPRHPLVRQALDLAGVLCHGHVIDDGPAMRHAVLVARLLVKHVPDAPAVLVCAALLHDAPDFVPPGSNLEAILDTTVAPGVARLVRALQAEHVRMEDGGDPRIGDIDVTVVTAADKTVAFRSLVARARRSGDEPAFWARRVALQQLLPYFHTWARLAGPQLPGSMRAELERELSILTDSLNAAVPPVMIE